MRTPFGEDRDQEVDKLSWLMRDFVQTDLYNGLIDNINSERSLSVSPILIDSDQNINQIERGRDDHHVYKQKRGLIQSYEYNESCDEDKMYFEEDPKETSSEER